MPRTKNQQKKLHVKKGDMVALTKAITSAQELDMDRQKGYTGRILRVFPSKEMVIVEGVNVRIRHTKPNQQYPQGGRIQREMPIHASNVMPLDSDGKPTRVRREYADGQWVRIAQTNGQPIG